MRSPSSLIFIVLLGVWAAYFVQYWIRRRDHLATARSVDQFSAAMRVLERRDVAPHADLSAPARPSYSVHPERSARPRILVKRALPAAATRPSEVTMSIENVSTAPSGPAGTEHSGRHPEVPSASGPASQVRPSRRVRGLLLLASVLALLVVVVLVALSVMPVWAIAPGILAPAVGLAWVRSAARADQAAARARRRRAVERTHRRSSAATPARGSATAAVAAQKVSAPTSRPAGDGSGENAHGEDTHGERVAAGATPASEAVVDTEDTEDVYDSRAVPGVADSGVAAPVVLVDEDDLPLTWDPVPVPRPTYTMKAKAERPEPVPAATTRAAAPVDPDDRAYESQRIAGA